MARLLGVGVSSIHRWEKAERSAGGPNGSVLQLYRALDRASRRGHSPKQILRDVSGDPGTFYARLFAIAHRDEVQKQLREDHAVLPYYGSSGVTAQCLRAVARLLTESEIERVRVVSPPPNDQTRSHGLFVTCDPEGWVVVLPGFASGYAGEGPSGLSLAVALLHYHGVQVDELVVDSGLFARFESTTLTRDDVDHLAESRATARARVLEYIKEKHWEEAKAGTLWQHFGPQIPFSLLHPRLMDLARSFWKDPDAKLITAYRRLEDRIRHRTGLSESGSKLMSSAFLGEKAPLGWGELPRAEAAGRGQRFTSAYQTYRNPRAHQEPLDSSSRHAALRELMALNELYWLEAAAVNRTQDADDDVQARGEPSALT